MYRIWETRAVFGVRRFVPIAKEGGILMMCLNEILGPEELGLWLLVHSHKYLVQL